MAAYIVATVRIHDPDKFAEYATAVAGMNERYGGEPLVRGAVEEVLEGDGMVGERVVVSRFATAEAAKAYILSAEYQAVRAKRKGAAEVVMRLVIG